MNAKKIVDTLLEHIAADGGNISGNGSGGGGGEEPRMMNIGTIFAALPPGVDQQCIDIMNQENDTIAMAKKLKVVLRPHAAALEKVGVVADYLAYMLVAVAQQQRGI
jgi:hypothetical protein